MDKFERLKDIIRNKKNDFNINNFVDYTQYLLL